MNAESHPNVELVQRFFAAYAADDFETMRNKVLAPDVTWRIPGHHPLAGAKRGADEVIAYFAQLPKADFQADPIVMAADGDYVVHRGWAHYDDATIDMNWVLVYRIDDGRIRDVQNFAADQHAADLFFWQVWGDELKPVPDRLRGSR